MMDSQGRVSQADYHAALDNRDKREADYRKRIAELEVALSSERARVIAQIEALIKAKWQAAYDNMERAVSDEFRTAFDMRQAAIAHILDEVRSLGQPAASACNCSQEDVHNYGPCDESCRSLIATGGDHE